MKQFILTIIMGLSIISCGVELTSAPHSPNVKTRFYDKHGSYSGYSECNESGRCRYYDKRGRYKGYSR